MIGLTHGVRRIFRLVDRIRGRVPTRPPFGAVELHADPPDAGTDRERPRTKSDIVIETGVRPSEFVCSQVQASGGKLSQQELLERTGVSPSTLSQMLTEMEEAGTIHRRQFGSRKFVYLPGMIDEDGVPRDVGTRTD